MQKKGVIILLIIGIFFINLNSVSAINSYWRTNLTINASLPFMDPLIGDPGFGTGGSSLSVFYKDSSWQMLSGNYDGNFYGFAYNGTDWSPNSTINASLPNIASSAPTVFYKDSSWYLISGGNTGRFYGYAYNGTNWIKNLTINASLPDIGSSSAPTVFYKDSSWYLISGGNTGRFYGYAYNGTNWIKNLTINASLPDIGSSSAPTVFYKDSSWYLLSGDDSGNIFGFAYNGTNWIPNSTINASLSNIGTSLLYPFVFYKDNSLYLICGSGETNFYGYDYYLPAIKIHSPIIDENISTSNVSFKIETNENSTCFYSLNSGVTNYSMTSDGSSLNYTSSRIINKSGNYTATFFCSHISDNSNHSDSVSFNVLLEDVRIILNQTGIVYGQELLWKANATGTYDEQSIAIYFDGIVYINSQKYNIIYAINATDGSTMWEFDANYETGINGFGGPSYSEGIIYDAFNQIWAINATTGEKIWNYSLPGVLFSQNVAFNDKYVVAVSFQSGIIQVLNKTTGEEVLNINIGEAISTEPLLYQDYIITTFSNYSGILTNHFIVSNITDGTEIYSSNLGGAWDSSPILYNNIIYGVGGYNLNALHLENGSIIWNSTIGTTCSTPSIHNGKVFIGLGSENVVLQAYNSSTGLLIWTFNDSEPIGYNDIYNQPSVSNGIVFFNSKSNSAGGDGYIYAINETDGTLIWKYHLSADIFGYTSIAEGNIYVVTDSSYLYAFDFGKGAGDWPSSGYDSNRTGYCPDCLNEWQYVKANCTTDEYTTCTVKNYYDHNVSFISLYYNSSEFNWYTDRGELIETNSSNHTILEMSPLESKNFIISSSFDSDLIDTIFPKISILSPIEATYTSSEISFELETSEYSICEYSLDEGSTNYSMNANLTGTGFTTSGIFSNGDYIVTFYCSDSWPNLNTTSISFSVNIPSSGSKYSTFIPSEEELNKGYQRIMYKNYKVYFKLGNISHTFKIENINKTNVNLVIYSEPQESTLSIGQEKKFEISGDNYYDLLVRLNSISTEFIYLPKANITMQTIHEEINLVTNESITENVAENNTDTEDAIKRANKIIYFILGGVVLLALIVWILFKKAGIKKGQRKFRY